jgi:hypothetical protein
MAATVGGTDANPTTMLCTNNDVSAHTDICLTGVREGGPMGEVGIFYDVSYGAVDHIAISSWKHGNPSGPDARQYIGVIRNFSGTGSNGSILRCFATWLSGPKLCSAPSDSFYMPEGVPYMFTDLPVVPNSAVKDASNSDGSPSKPIAGAN